MTDSGRPAPVTRGEILMKLSSQIGGNDSAYGVTMIEGYRMFLKAMSGSEEMDKIIVMGELPAYMSLLDAPPSSGTGTDPLSQ